MPDFPTDVIVDILSRLPVKSLLRFRCVSKPFCALIDSHEFIKSHLKRSIDTETHLSLILGNLYGLHSLDLDSLNSAVELDHPFKSDVFSPAVLGSSDGLLCLFNYKEDGDDITLWNPSTRRYRKLPVERIDFPEHFTRFESFVYGFGYDPFTDDYKVVRLIEFYGQHGDLSDYEVKVYSMKSNSWRRIPDFPYFLTYQHRYGVLVGSALHWVVSLKHQSDNSNLIAAFDLTTEEYLLVPQPEFSSKDFHKNVWVLEGCLCILCNYIKKRVDVWVMKDYGVKESWRKLFSVAQPEVITSFNFVVPLAYSKNGRDVLLVQDNEKLVWYNVKRNKVKKIEAHGMPEKFGSIFIYVESLVPLAGGGKTYGKNHDVKGKKQKNNPKKNEKKRIPQLLWVDYIVINIAILLTCIGIF